MTKKQHVFVIGIDGPSGVGKSTLGAHLARGYDYAFLDTGLIYRWVASLIEHIWGDHPPFSPAASPAPSPAFEASREQEEKIVAILRVNIPSGESMIRDFWKKNPLAHKHELLAQENLALRASRIASLSAVRAMILPMQQSFARHPPGAKKGAILVGRDVTTTICPDGDFLLFLDAKQSVREKRASLSRPGSHSFSLTARDQRDTKRKTSPLKKRSDIASLDTSYLSVEESLHKIRALVDGKKSGILSPLVAC